MKLISLLAATAAIAMATPAQSATLLYQVTGSYTLSFQIDSKPVVTSSGFGGFGAHLTGSIYEKVFFYNTYYGGGLSVYLPGNVSVIAPYGPQLFYGSVDDPTLYTGVFGLSNGMLLTVTEVLPVPEPVTWAMMIGGLGLIGGLMRRRAKVRTTVSFG